MADKRYVFGDVTQSDEPVWEPLERVVGEELAGAFMWMYEIDAGEHGRLHAYKHIHTRRYLHLDHEGRAYEYIAGERYRGMPLADALELALRLWWERLAASPEDEAAAREAIERARRAVRDS